MYLPSSNEAYSIIEILLITHDERSKSHTSIKELFNKFDPDAMQLIKGYIKHQL